jgi:hypothetical protein
MVCDHAVIRPQSKLRTTVPGAATEARGRGPALVADPGGGMQNLRRSDSSAGGAAVNARLRSGGMGLAED